ncbi:MAG: succinylglutamate desuccinylase/aspartoacylase domain-containing protein [Candidatus Kerfeldbacteria bacterium]|jgi:succinylglutamate desuccinylase/aspartoacylase family protein
MKRKKILFLAATHGNEGFTIPILKKLTDQKNLSRFDWKISNPEALEKNKRFIDADLNRVAPGNKDSFKYEIRRAYELMQVFKKYDYVIDIHGTPAKTGIFTIVTNPKKENLLLSTLLPFQNIVIWSPKNLKKPGPLTQFVDCGVEIECGSKNSVENQNKLYSSLKDFLKKDLSQDQKTFFRVYGKLLKKDYEDKEGKFKEFEEVNIKGEKFFALLVNRYVDITCYKMEKININ